MAVPEMRGSRSMVAIALLLGAAAMATRADEIKLKDGKKLNGVIVGFEDNMYKIKTDFGYIFVEKDKVALIVNSSPAEPKKESPPAATKESTPAIKAPVETPPGREPAVESSNASVPGVASASAKSATPAAAPKSATKITAADVKPDTHAAPTVANAAAPTIKGSTAAPASGLTTAAAAPSAPVAPKEPEVPANKEEIQGNLYTNYTHGFRMYKAPSWSSIEEARSSLPNAIVALGTFNQSTLMVIGEEKAKEPLAVAAATVEKRLHEVYENYRQISQRKSVVGGLPAIEYHYRGIADDHDWSGTLVVVGRGSDILTVLGMTYADTDLIQIQENVISRSIASLDFNVR
jgi:hypothetical protein